MSVFAIILSAGASRRLGRPKQLERFCGETLLERAVRIAREAGCVPVIVLGCEAERIAQQCNLGDARQVINPDWATGMASSIQAGIAALPQEAAGALLMTCDQPAVTAEHLRLLLAEGESRSRVVASAYAGRNGVPAWIPADRFSELMRLEGDTGAREMMRNAQAIPLERGELDVDTEDAVQETHRLLAAK